MSTAFAAAAAAAAATAAEVVRGRDANFAR